MAISISPREQLLRDILTTAVEGGINYWANDRAEDGTLQVREVRRAASGDVTAILFDLQAVEDVSGAGVSSALNDHQRAGGRDVVKVGTAALRRALHAMHEGRVTFGGAPLNVHIQAAGRRALFDHPDIVDYDASDADVFVQAALFGDIVYG
jgi:hypothetical protein